MSNETYPGFGYPPEQISNYIFNANFFVFGIVPDGVISFCAQDPTAFREWLDSQGIRDITSEVGALITDYYFRKK